MSITRNQRNSRLKQSRQCPVCGRHNALVLNTYHGFRFCRWAQQGLCSLTEAAAHASFREQIVRVSHNDNGPRR